MKINKRFSLSVANPIFKMPAGAFLSFFIGFLAFYFLPIGGQLYISDLFCLFFAAICLLSGRVNRTFATLGMVGNVLVACALAWLIQQCVTDLIRQTEFDNLIRGWSKIIIFIACIISVASITKLKMERIVLCACGFAVAKILETALFPNDYTRDLPWKYGYSFPVAVLVISYICFFHKKYRVILLPISLVFLGIANVVMNFRSMFLFCMISAGVCFAVDMGRLFFGSRKLRASLYMPLVIAMMAITTFSAKEVYEYAANNGVLGAEAQQKYYAQSSGDLSILQAGRNESLVSTVAIKNSPIIGYGSWAKNHDYAVMQIELLRQKHIEAQYSGDGSAEFIPTHSYILGAWVEAGIVGALFWAVAFTVVLGAAFLIVDAGGSFMCVGFFLFINLLWNIPFSPFGADTRLSAAITLCCALSVLKTTNVERIFRSTSRNLLRRA